MLASYFKIALRYLAKNRVYSSINVIGLSMSLACAILMILYTQDEFSFDRFQRDLNSTFLIAIDVQNPDGSSTDKMGITSVLHGPEFKDKLPEVKSFVRMTSLYRDVQLKGEPHAQKVLVADTNFFSFFTFPLIKGNPRTALRDVHSIVITEEMAIRHFGKEDPIGKIVLLGEKETFVPYQVTGVTQRCPQNSSIQFEAVIPLQEVHDPFDWVNVSYSTFVKLHELSDPLAVSAKMQKVFEEGSREVMAEVRNYGFTQTFHHELQPFSDIHLSEEFKAEAGLTNPSSATYSYILSGIAVFVLLMACINFINLTIARSTKRAKEIGIRKVVGSRRRQLIGQFLGESFLLCLVSFIVAVMLAALLLPIFNNLVNKELSLSYLASTQLILTYVALLIVTGLLAGFYPAVVLSAYSPIQSLYARVVVSSKNLLQQSLVVFQFAMATFMVVGTLTVYRQFDFLTNRDLGYQPDHIVKVNKRGLTPLEAKSFREELLKHPDILAVSPQYHGTENGKINGDTIFHFTYESVSEDFISLMGIKLEQGRDFAANNPSDSAHGVIINQAFAREAGWKEPLGHEVKMMDGATRRVIGVVQDYNYASLKRAIEPQLFSLAFNLDNTTFQHVLIRIQPNSESRCMALIEQTYKKWFPMVPYSYQFYQEINRAQYEAESKWAKVILLSAVLSILIAGIGLLGLSILTAESKVKEIGIRKVLGASVRAIVVALYKRHLALISLALLIAIPASYYAGKKWLANYAYRIDVGAEMFVTAALLVLAIAGLTIAYQTVKTALLNPVDTLRSE